MPILYLRSSTLCTFAAMLTCNRARPLLLSVIDGRYHVAVHEAVLKFWRLCIADSCRGDGVLATQSHGLGGLDMLVVIIILCLAFRQLSAPASLKGHELFKSAAEQVLVSVPFDPLPSWSGRGNAAPPERGAETISKTLSAAMRPTQTAQSSDSSSSRWRSTGGSMRQRRLAMLRLRRTRLFPPADLGPVMISLQTYGVASSDR